MRSSTWMVGIFLALLLQSAAALSQSDDCSALLQFADSFNISEDPWMFDGKPFPRTITSWKNGTDCCSWDGVTCDHDDDVIEIDLRSSGLCGAFLSNSTLFSLRKLRRLKLNGNCFLYSDSVASNWTSPLMFLDMSFSLIDEVKLNSLLDKIVSLKTTLQYLDLSGNPIVGEIPKSIGKLTNLQYLGLSSNTIVGEIPKSIGKLTNLQYLDLSGNTIVGEIPNSIGKLTNLQHLGLSKTSIMGSLPLTFSNLENLSYLNLYGIENLNGTVDFEIFAKMRKMNTLIFPGHQLNVVLRDSGNVSFPELTRLSLSGCNLTKFPYFLSSSKGLQSLDLSKNNITGPIPRWFWTIWNNTLDMLDLSDNLITGFLQPFTWNLRRFDLHNNILRGPLPEFLLPSVQYIDASNNFLTGLIPDCIWNLTNLQFLSFRLNHFQGLIPIPPLSLEYYSVSDNMLTGKIPSAICNSFNLAVLNLSNNSLVGSIPQCFENIRDSPLSVLNLRKNNLIGEIPSICGPYNSLQTVDLSQNNLRGTIPRSLANCTELEVVDLSSNTLNDVFPSWLAALVNLQVLVLRSNMFHGPVKYYDYEVTDPFPQLRILDISMNQFSGSLPIEYMAKFKAMMDADITTEKGNLQFISNMGYNYDDSIQVVMKGHSIELVKILKVFTTIDLSMNSFHGEIPNIVGDLKALKGLNFSHNHITGIIPSSIGNLHNLEWLDLSSNNLTGEIPKPIAGLTFLTYINLSSNRLTGEIPSGPQFNTFTSDQFEGNPGLCGLPLPKPCGSLKSPPPTYHGKDDDEHDGWINWRVAVAMGYGSGLVFGLFASYLILEITFRPKCLVLWVDRMILRFERRSKKRMEVPIAAAARSGHHGR